MKKISSINLLIILICFFSNTLFAQVEETIIDLGKRNAIMIEGLGHGFAYSINYERILVELPRTATTIQIGLSYYGEPSGVIPFWMPVTVNQMFLTKENQYIEIGAGRMLNDDGIYLSKDSFINEYRFDDWVFRLGYRLHSNNQKWVFRAAYTPIYQDVGELIHWGSLAAGYRF
ncbi:MAG: hypothetical protein AB8G11_09045 [Saprospiraceae bacterium]